MGAFDVCNTKKQGVNAIFMRYLSKYIHIYIYIAKVVSIYLYRYEIE